MVLWLDIDEDLWDKLPKQQRNLMKVVPIGHGWFGAHLEKKEGLVRFCTF